MKKQTIKAISQLLKEELDSSYWGAITLRVQKGEVVNIVKEQSIKLETRDTDSGTKFAQ